MIAARTVLRLVLSSLALLPAHAAAQTPRTGDVAVNGVSIHYRVYGQGEPLLLLHGFSHTGQAWEPMIPELSSSFQLIVPDMRGHGLSTNPSGEFTHRLAGRDFLGLLDSLRVRSVVGVGHSSGGRALLDLALLAPDRVSAMVLVGSAHRFADEARGTLAGATVAGWKEVLPGYIEVVQSWHPNGEAQLHSLAAQVRAMARDVGPSNEELKALTVPTLVAHGDRDEINPASLALELYELLPRAELWLMPGVTHAAFVSHWVHPEELGCGGCALAARQFPAVLRDFLDRNR